MNWPRSFWKALTTPGAGRAPVFVETPTNFTPRAQQALAFARSEADRFHHYFVGTEHLLLGLVRLGQGTAVNVLGKLGIDLETMRVEIEKQVGAGPDQGVSGLIPYTPRVKRVLALAAKEAKALNHSYVGTEHLLLGLLLEGDGVAARVLKHFEVDIEKTRQEILKQLDPNFHLTVSDSGSPEISWKAESLHTHRDSVDTNKRYDVYCTERDEEIVYRNALFKGRKTLLKTGENDFASQFLELEQADGQTVFVALTSVVKFCEHGATPGAERTSDDKS
jgi:hypothetical protein